MGTPARLDRGHRRSWSGDIDEVGLGTPETLGWGHRRGWIGDIDKAGPGTPAGLGLETPEGWGLQGTLVSPGLDTGEAGTPGRPPSPTAPAAVQGPGAAPQSHPRLARVNPGPSDPPRVFSPEQVP